MALNWTIPEGWRESRDGPRHILNGPIGEVVIAAATKVVGSGSVHERQFLLERLRLDTERSVSNILRDPGLRIEHCLADEQISETALWWTCYATTTDQTSVFFAAVRTMNDEVVALVTYEGPPENTARSFFKKLLSGISVV